MAGFMCCLWWFLAGVLLGWLLNWLFDKFFRRGGRNDDTASGGNAGNAGNRGNGVSGAYVARSTPAVTPQAIAPTVAAPTAAVPAVAAPAFGAPASSGASLGAATLASAAAASGYRKLKTTAGHDNFEVIEGIGPKINELMHAAGVRTFAALAALNIPDITEILDAAGPNFKLANPETWAQQASLCASGQWEKLKVWQDELVAGVTIKKDNT